jgi:3-hydroxypropanoate dehydrogenase
MSVPQEYLDQIFCNTVTVTGFQPKPVDEGLLRKALELVEKGQTSLNCSPMRLVFVRTAEGKEKLKKCMMEANVAKTMEAPVTAIVCFDTNYTSKLPELCPAFDAKAVFDNVPAMIEPVMIRNGNLQGGYLLLALRAVGLDCGPMSGFDNAAVDAAFLEGTTWKSNFLINIGYGVVEPADPTPPLLAFEHATMFA